jgi:hypothetical protein
MTGVFSAGQINERFPMYRSGSTKNTQIGYINRNKQRCEGTGGIAGTDRNAYAYKMVCLLCKHVYGSNGTDVFQRKCPKCQNGKPGIRF